jgi:Flp pilus assembly protein TadG
MRWRPGPDRTGAGFGRGPAVPRGVKPLARFQLARPRPAGASGRSDAGNAALELVILAPVLLFLIGLVIAAGRTSAAQGSVAAAARDAARQASLAVSPAAAIADGRASALTALRADGLGCDPLVNVDVSGFATQPGQSASVSATVVCVVPLSDLVVPGMPGSKKLTGYFASPLDPYRAR